MSFSFISLIDGADDCAAESYLGYWGLIIWISLSIYIFIGLYVLCEEYFVPSLTILGEKWKLSEDVCGATLMAAGSSSPELFTALIGVFLYPKENPGPSTNCASAVFNMCIIIGLSIIMSGLSQAQLLSYPFLRDSLFYGISALSLYTFYEIATPGKIEIGESLTLVLIWVVYVIVLAYDTKFKLLINRICCQTCHIKMNTEVYGHHHGVFDNEHDSQGNLRNQLELIAVEDDDDNDNDESDRKEREININTNDDGAKDKIKLKTKEARDKLSKNVQKMKNMLKHHPRSPMSISRGDEMYSVERSPLKESQQNEQGLDNKYFVFNVDNKNNNNNNSNKENKQQNENNKDNMTNINTNTDRDEMKKKNNLKKKNENERDYAGLAGVTPMTLYLKQKNMNDEKQNDNEQKDETDHDEQESDDDENENDNSSSDVLAAMVDVARSSGKTQVAVAAPAPAHRSNSNLNIDIDVDSKPLMLDDSMQNRNGDDRSAGGGLNISDNRRENNDRNNMSICNNNPLWISFKNKIHKYLELSIIPFKIVFEKTNPNIHASDSGYTLSNCKLSMSFIISILWLASLTWLVVDLSNKIGLCLSLTPDVMGLTLLAIGSSLPDTFSSILVAKQGKMNMAVSNALGSNVFDICICVGLSFFIKAILNAGKAIVVERNVEFQSFIIALFVLLIMFVALLAFDKLVIKKSHGFILIVAYTIFIVSFSVVLDDEPSE